MIRRGRRSEDGANGRAGLAPPGQEGQPTTQEISRSILSVVRRGGRSSSKTISAEFDLPPASLGGCFAMLLEVARSALLARRAMRPAISALHQGHLAS